MNRLCIFALSFAACLAPLAQASPAGAASIQKEYQLAMETWTLQLKTATTPKDLDAAAAKRPDPFDFAKRMWSNIGGSLKEDWTLDPAAWFLRLSASLQTRKPDGSAAPAFSDEIELIRKAVETNHLNSPKLNLICIALSSSSDPRSLALLEKIAATNPDPKIQGTASISAAIIYRSLGDSPDVMQKRLSLIRKSIIQSADVEVNGTTIAKMAEDELYIIRFLTKGRVAPDLTGTDAAGKALSLADYKGKVTVLLFWNSSIPDASRVIEISAALNEKFKDKPFALIGVNNDPLEKLRQLQGDGTVAWRNFSDPGNKLASSYRVGTWPLVYVLDGERKIHYAGSPGSFVELTASALLSQEATPAPPAE